MLRAYVPVPAKIVPVYEDNPFPGSGHIQKCVSGFLQFEGGGIYCRTILFLGTPRKGPGRGFIRHFRHWKSSHFPSAKYFAAVDADVACDSFAVVEDFFSKIDSAHILYKDVQRRSNRDVNLHIVLVLDSVERPCKFSVYINGGIIVQPRNAQCPVFWLVEMPGVKNVTVSLAEFFEIQGTVGDKRLHRFQMFDDVAARVKPDFGNFYYRIGFRWRRQILSEALRDGFPQNVVLIGGLPCFVYRSIVVVAGKVGLQIFS